MLFDRLINLNLDLALLGLEQRDNADVYYCTPKNAAILGWAGVDGIHYCTIPEFGEMIFAVSPMNIGDCVHPVARSIDDLFSLLLSCGDMSVLEQCHAWDRSQYDTFLRDNPVREDQRKILDQIQQKMGLVPITDVFAYVKALQDEFDVSKIPYTEDYYDPDMNPDAPIPSVDWIVTYDGGLWSQIGEPGQEVALNRVFQWNQEKWVIPSMYLCKEGLVIDYLVRVEPERVQSFLQKWHLDRGDEPYDEETLEQIQRENPLEIDFCGEVQYNQVTLRRDHSCGTSWLPEKCRIRGWGVDPEAQRMLEHYELDREKAWVFHRAYYRWNGLRNHEPSSLSVRIVRNSERVSGEPFEIDAERKQTQIIHPVTGVRHILTVQAYCPQILSDSSFPPDLQNDMEYPRHCVMMRFTLEPEIPASEFFVQDLSKGDSPRPQKQENDSCGPGGMSASAVGIIGGSDGPTVVMAGNARNQKNCSILSGSATAPLHNACSSLHFEPMEKVIWKPVFQVKRVEDMNVNLLKNESTESSQQSQENKSGVYLKH